MSSTVLDAGDLVEKQNKIHAIIKNRIFWRGRWLGKGADISSKKNHERKEGVEKAQRALFTDQVLKHTVPSLTLHNNPDVLSSFYSTDGPQGWSRRLGSFFTYTDASWPCRTQQPFYSVGDRGVKKLPALYIIPFKEPQTRLPLLEKMQILPILYHNGPRRHQCVILANDIITQFIGGIGREPPKQSTAAYSS